MPVNKLFAQEENNKAELIVPEILFADSLQNEAANAFQALKFELARKLVLEARAIYRANQADGEKLFQTYIGMYHIAYNEENQEKENQSIDSLYAFFEQFKNPSFDWMKRVKNVEIAMYTNRGDFVKSYEKSKEIIEIIERDELSKASPFTAIAFTNMGIILGEQGNVQRNIEYQLKALEILHLSPQKSIKTEVGILASLGNAYLENNELEQAKKTCWKIFDILKKGYRNEIITISTYVLLAEIYKKEDQEDSVFYYINQVEKINPEFRKRQRLDLEAAIKTKAKQYQQAIAILKKNLEGKEVKGVSRFESSILNKIAYNHQLDGKYHDCLKFQYQALQASEPDFIINSFGDVANFESDFLPKVDVIESISSVAYSISQITNNTDSLQMALQLYRRVSQIGDEARKQTLVESDKFRLSKVLNGNMKSAFALAHRLYNQSQDPQFIEDAFFFAEKNKAAVLLENILISEANRFGEIPDSLAQREAYLRGMVLKLEKERADAQKIKKEEKLLKINEQIIEIRSEIEDLGQYLAKNFKKYHDLKFRHNIATPQQVQETLQNDELFIEYFAGNDQLYAISLTAQKAAFQAFPLDEKNAVNCEKQYKFLLNSNMSNNKPAQEYAQLSQQLYQNFLAPILEKTAFQGTKIIVANPSCFAQLPMAAWIVEPPKNWNNGFAKAKFVLHQYATSRTNSATLFVKKQTGKKQQNNQQCLASAPSFTAKPLAETTRSEDLDELEGTSSEVQDLSTLFKGIFVREKKATKQQFLKNAEDFSLLHLATHGILDDENPMNSHLVFFNENEIEQQTKQNYALYPHEISRLNLTADLTVLSACETGVGKMQQGEGMMSLARSFSYAGSSALLTTLWKIDDGSSPEIIRQFYQHLKNYKNKSTSLRDAQLDWLKTADSNKAHPYFWAGFVLYDNTKPLSGSLVAPFYPIKLFLACILGGFLVLLALFFFFRKQKRSIA